MKQNQKNLRRLGQISQLLQDAALAELSAANRACDETRRKLKGLDFNEPDASELPLHVLAQATVLHRRWSEPHRMRLNELLSRQLAARLNLEHVARRCLGRSEVISKLQRKHQSD